MKYVPTLAIALATSCVLLLLPSAAWTQEGTGTIAGIVKDTSGAVMPGVTVEAASPALIEKVRSVVSDAAGNYKIVNLRPGKYSVTFTLPGFTTVTREGVELTTGFTANVNAEMKVGALAETVTVSGASPVVDVQNVKTQAVISAAVISEVPTSRNAMGMVALTLGASGGGGFTGNGGNRDVGGNNGEGTGSIGIHGSRVDGIFAVEGMKANSLSVDGTTKRFYMNIDAIQETVLDTGGAGAASETGGVSSNTVLKEGGNAFKGMFESEITGNKLQGKNLNADLTNRGLLSGNSTRKVYSSGGGVGGPVAKDRLWFYSAFRWWGNKENQAGIYYNLPSQLHTPFYTQDVTHPGFISAWNTDSTSRVTWQAAEKHKVSIVPVFQKHCGCQIGVGPTRAPETGADFVVGGQMLQVTWTHPRTNRLLFEAGASLKFSYTDVREQPESLKTDLGYLNVDTGISYGASVSAGYPSGGYGLIGHTRQYNAMGAMSYVTGSHAIKIGMQEMFGRNPNFGNLHNPPIQIQFRGGKPFQVLEIATPGPGGGYYVQLNSLLGLYGQDQWTIKRLTLNLGLRFDYLNASTPAVDRPAGPFIAALSFPATSDLPDWKDLGPRLGAAYDLFGNGKTAIKGSVGRYVISNSSNVVAANSPIAVLGQSVTRPWTLDPNGNLFPDCNLANPAANGECGAATSSTFGTPVITSTWDPKLLKGFDVRPYSWQGAVTLQQELKPGIGVAAGYFRTWYGNVTVTANRALTAADFTGPYSVVVPTDSRLPNSGQTLTGFYDITPAGQAKRQDNFTYRDPKRTEVYNGADFSVSARFGKGGMLNGGVAIGKTHINNCDVIDNPAGTQWTGNGSAAAPPAPFATVSNFSGTQWQKCATDNRNDQFKVNVVYPMPWGINTSAIYQNIPGLNRTATVTYTSAQVIGLGRNLTTGSANVQVLDPNSKREIRASQLDARFSKSIKFRNATIKPGFDIYNLLNSNDVLAITTAYSTTVANGGTWLKPGGILAARLFKFNVFVEF